MIQYLLFCKLLFLSLTISCGASALNILDLEGVLEGGKEGKRDIETQVAGEKRSGAQGRGEGRGI